ncbi:hypothetical protein QTP88_002816 [Uroleucon formosanum]
MGITGNETADKAADLATRIIPHPTISDLLTNDIQSSVKLKIYSKWQHFWDSVPPTNKLKTTKNDIKKWSPPHHLNRQITVSDSAHQTENYNSEMYIEPTSETSIINETNEYDNNNLNNTSNVVPNEIFKNVNEKQKKGGNKERLLQEIRQGREEPLKNDQRNKATIRKPSNTDFFLNIASTVMTFPPELALEARNRVCNIISEIELRALKTNISMGTMDQETASSSTSSSTQNIIPVTSEESLQSYSRIPVDEQNPNNNTFTYLNYLPMTYD